MQREVRRKITRYLFSLKMKTNSGFAYWSEAIFYCIMKELEGKNKTFKMMDLYEYLAKKFDTTYSKIEKNMRYAKEQSNYIEVLNLDRSLRKYEFLNYCIYEVIDSFQDNEEFCRKQEISWV